MEINLRGNQSYHIKPNAGLCIRSGTAALFLVTEADQARHYLFDVVAGDWLLGLSVATIPPESNPEIVKNQKKNPEITTYHLIVLPYETTVLTQWEAFASLDTLTETLIQVWSEDPNDILNNIPVETRSNLHQWGDRWQQVLMSVGVLLPSLQTPDDLPAFLHALERGLAIWLETRTAQQQEQFAARQHLEQRAQTQAIADLSAMFPLRPAIVQPTESELLQVVRAVAAVEGFTVHEPTPAETSRPRQHPLEIIADVSGVRVRPVRLTANWWRSDCGALVGYEQDDHPVALLPRPGGGYDIYAPSSTAQNIAKNTAKHTVKNTTSTLPRPLQRLRLTAQRARTLAPIAYRFHRSFPNQAIQAWQILTFALRGRKRDILSILQIGVLASLLGMVLPIATGVLMDQILPDAQRQLLGQMVLALLMVNLGSGLFSISQSLVLTRLQTFAHADTLSATWDRLLKLKVAFFRQYTLGDLQTRLGAITGIRQLLGGAILQTVFSSVFSVLNLGVMWLYNPLLTGVAISLTVVTVGVTNLSAIQRYRIARPQERTSGYLRGLVVQLVAGVARLRTMGAEMRAFAHWSRHFRERLEFSLSAERIEDGLAIILLVLVVANPVILFAIAATQWQSPTLPNGLTIGRFLAFNSAYGIFFAGVSSLAGIVVSLTGIPILWERAIPILQSPLECDRFRTDPQRLQGNIRVEQVSFRYQDYQPWVLRQISLTIPAGSFVAIVGASGSGKSTLVRLLLGFEEPEEGAIFYDDGDLAQLDLRAVRRQLGVVLQDNYIEGASIFENLAAGVDLTLAEAWEAVELAGLADDIRAMPMGMATIVAEGGKNLSGGQRQRLLIARALRLRPSILIFDEATSFLDNYTQALLRDRLDQFKVTRVIVAHRLSTIQNADCIYVLENGGICQQGTFAELMAQEGAFQTLMQRQML